MDGLTSRHRRFVEEFLVDHNAAAAARRAGYAGRTGPRLLQRADIRAALAAARAEQSRRTGITADRVLREYARLAYADLRQVCRWDGESVVPLPSEDLDADAAAAVAEVRRGRDAVTVKLHDKKGALDCLSRHLGLFEGPGAADETADLAVTLYLPDNGRSMPNGDTEDGDTEDGEDEA